MREIIMMVVVLTVLSVLSGGMLSGLRNATAARIEMQQLKFVKGPAIKTILEGVSNDPITDRFKLKDAYGKERSFFVGKYDGKANAVAFETFGKGFGGNVGLMVAVNTDNDSIIGVGVTTHSETPGLGARAKDDPGLVSQFKGLPVKTPIEVTTDGGQINAMSGATITSRAVCSAATGAEAIYEKLKPQIVEKLKEFNK